MPVGRLCRAATTRQRSTMRVLYGIHGTGHGHAMRGLTIARRLGRHQFLFVANDDAPKVLEPEFPVCRIPNLGTVFKNYRVDLPATVRRALPLLWHRQRYIDEVSRLIDQFRPDVCMTDLEYFVPRAAERAGLPCLTLDHQHVITCCRHDLPRDMWWDAAIQGLTPRYLFRPTAENLIISFYAPPVLPRCCCPALPRPSCGTTACWPLQPHDAGHAGLPAIPPQSRSGGIFCARLPTESAMSTATTVPKAVKARGSSCAKAKKAFALAGRLRLRHPGRRPYSYGRSLAPGQVWFPDPAP